MSYQDRNRAMAGNPNLALMRVVAEKLGSLRDEVVFVGGCAAGLLLTVAR